MHIITNKILLSTLLATSLLLTGCSISDENTKEEVKPAEINAAETEESSGFFGSLFGGVADEAPKVEEAAETEESSSFFGSWFGDDKDDAKKDSSKNTLAIQSAVAKKYPKLTEDQQKIIAKIKSDAEVERKKHIEAIKVSNINAKVVAKIAKQTRLEDVEARLKDELNELNAQLKSEEQDLVKAMQAELDTKIQALNSEVQSSIADVKVNTKDQRVRAISSVERKISDTQSEVESKLMKKALATELDRFYTFKDNERKLEEQYLGKLSATKIELDKETSKQLKIMRQNIHAMKQSNQELLSIKASELERQRIADAIEYEKRTKEKNQAIIDKLVAKFKADADEYSNSTKSKLAKQEKEALTKITSKYSQDKAVRADKEKSYKVGLNAEITNAKKTAGDKMRVNLVAERDAKIGRIDEELESTIRGIYADRKQSLSSLESASQDQHKQEKSDLKVQYEKDKRELISQSKKDKSKIVSKSRARERELLAKERREIELVNKQIRSDIKAKKDAAIKN